MYLEETIARFASKVDVKSFASCWEWKAALNQKGYGVFRINGKTVKAHRVAYELVNGAIPEDLMVLHKCDNRRCCNPSHLYAGNGSDNNRDRAERNPNNQGGMPRRISSQLVADVKILASSLSQVAIAKRVGISRASVYNILHGYYG